ncbi:MAG: PDZ domain-containing protein [Planctomycetota bacterium]
MNRRFLFSLIALAVCSIVGPSGACADERRDSRQMMQLLRPVAETVADSMAQVICGNSPVALAVAVDSDGLLITKRSELTSDPIQVRLSDNRLYPARVAATSRPNDLAILKLDASVRLTPVRFQNTVPAIASFLVTPGRTGRAIGVGVLSANQRRIEAAGRLGVNFSNVAEARAMVSRVVSGSGAERAGIEEGDIILRVNGVEQPDEQRVRAALKQLYPGEEVRLTVLRGADNGGARPFEVSAQISELDSLGESKNDSLVNGPRNIRVTGFDVVLQHDTVLDPDECGGPILDSAGRVVGLNIARAGRVVTYALPASLINSELPNLIARARR